MKNTDIRPNRVVIRISGGCYQGASADDPNLQVILIDDDNIGAGDIHPFGSEENCEKVLATMFSTDLYKASKPIDSKMPEPFIDEPGEGEKLFEVSASVMIPHAGTIRIYASDDEDAEYRAIHETPTGDVAMTEWDSLIWLKGTWQRGGDLSDAQTLCIDGSEEVAI